MIQSFQTSSYSNKQIKMQIVFLGDMGVGKSSLIERYCENVFNQQQAPTVAIDRMERVLTLKSVSYRLVLWDTAGQERFRSMIPGYLKMGNFCIIVFDVTNRKSFESVQGWIDMYKEHKEGNQIAILGNKIDAQRRVTKEEAGQFCKGLGLRYIEVSALTGEGIQEAFNSLIDVWGKQPLSCLPSTNLGPSSQTRLFPENTPETGKPAQPYQASRRSGCCHI